MGSEIARLAGILVLALLVSGTPARTVTAATVAEVIVSAPDRVIAGSVFTAYVNVNRVDNFDAGNYDVSFDHAVLALENVTAGQIGSTQIPVDIWNPVSNGRIRIVQNVPGIAGVSGAGSLAVLHFRVVGSAGQSSPISLSNGMLSNNMAEAIAATWGSSPVQVIAGQVSGQVTQPSAPVSPGPGIIGTQPAPSELPLVRGELPPSSPTEPEPGVIPQAVPPMEQPSTLAGTPSGAAPVPAPIPQASQEPNTTKAVNRMPDVITADSRAPVQTNPMNRPAVWVATGVAMFILGLVFSMFTTRRRSR